MAILEETVARDQVLSPIEFLTIVRDSGLETPEEATEFMREDRDARSDR